MDWREVSTQSEADELMELFGDFHDGCIHEAHVWTGYSVDGSLAMAVPMGLETNIRMTVQRQWTHPTAIELLFAEVTRFVLTPPPEHHEAIIVSATLTVAPEAIHWADVGGWTPDQAAGDCTWVACRKLFWREADEYVGEELHYGPDSAP